MKKMMVLGAMLALAGCVSSSGDRCGDGVCGGAEGCGTCAADCGSCTMTCGPENCAGCCSFGICIAVPGDSACGFFGEGCYACDAGEICSLQEYGCALDLASEWGLVLDSAEVATSDLHGSSWDIGGLPDIKVQVNRGGSVWELSCPDNRTSCDFPDNQLVFAASELVSQPLEFTVWDADPTGDEWICGFQYTFTTTTLSSFSETVICVEDAGLGSSYARITLHMEPVL